MNPRNICLSTEVIGAEINRPNDELEAINEVANKIYGGGGKQH